MGKKNSDKKKPTTAQTEVPKTRKQRAKMRTPKDSFAGNLADRLAANRKQFDDVVKSAGKVPGFADVFDSAGSMDEVIAFLNAKASENFTPERGKAGRQAVAFVAGQQIIASPECVQMMQTQFPKHDFATAKFFVADNYAPTGDKKKDTQLPVRLDSPALDAPFLGWNSRKWFTPAA